MDLDVNGRPRPIEDPWLDDPLLWTLREALGLVGTKHGCGVGVCGACTVLVDGTPARACLLPTRTLAGRRIETVEGLAGPGGVPHLVQQAWLDANVPQCGYCQAGQIMATVALLRERPRPTDAEVNAALDGLLCRCATQQRIRAAVRRAAAAGGGRP
ncbi:MAG: (2Fe-2S)-binding protein [Burkholderiales bacterium]|jgi:isoquinoline 1-oxidoreductase alpha subunit